MKTITSISASAKYNLAVKNNGAVLFWGWSYPIDGQNKGQYIPIALNFSEPVTLGIASSTFPLLLGKSGRVWITKNSYIDTVPQIIKICSGNTHYLALTRSKQVFAWGDNRYSQLAQQDISELLEPKQVIEVQDIIDISVGRYHNIALDSWGQMWEWGWNYDKQLSTTIEEQQIIPVANSNFSDVKYIAAGHYHSVVANGNGTVWTWGTYEDGSDEEESQELVIVKPSQIEIPAKVVELAAGFSFSLALDDNGRVWSWGRNDFGQLGNDGLDFSMTPTIVVGLEKIIHVTAGESHSLALDESGRVWGWGNGSFGVLGMNANEQNSRPILIIDS